MFRAYLGMEERYEKSFVGGWYRTGDLAERDEDGYFWFVGRGDDVIKSAGHLIGPFEVESVMMEHPAVAEAGVIGKPDEVAGEVVKAFVSLNPGYTCSRPGSWAFPPVTSPPWKDRRQNERLPPPRPPPTDAAGQEIRGEMRPALPGGEDPRFPPSVHR
jgi:acyl-CoA synthetase (AMP-forming)/AMP-acid ligase II